MLLRQREDKAFAPLVSFIFIVIVFPYKHIRKRQKKRKNNEHMEYTNYETVVMQVKKKFGEVNR